MKPSNLLAGALAAIVALVVVGAVLCALVDRTPPSELWLVGSSALTGLLGLYVRPPAPPAGAP